MPFKRGIIHFLVHSTVKFTVRRSYDENYAKSEWKSNVETTHLGDEILGATLEKVLEFLRVDGHG